MYLMSMSMVHSSVLSRLLGMSLNEAPFFCSNLS